MLNGVTAERLSVHGHSRVQNCRIERFRKNATATSQGSMRLIAAVGCGAISAFTSNVRLPLAGTFCGMARNGLCTARPVLRPQTLV